MKKSIKKNEKENMITKLNGLMTSGSSDEGLRILDFACTEEARVEPFVATCRVQGMRDGNVYITEMAKRVRNQALFREDNSTLSVGQNGRYYFVFTLPQEQEAELSERLVHQALAVAQKVDRMLKRKEVGE